MESGSGVGLDDSVQSIKNEAMVVVELGGEVPRCHNDHGQKRDRSAPGGAGREGGVHLLVVDEQGAALRFHGRGPGRHRGSPGGGPRGCRARRGRRTSPGGGGGRRGAAGREHQRSRGEEQTTTERSGEGRTWHGGGLYQTTLQNTPAQCTDREAGGVAPLPDHHDRGRPRDRRGAHQRTRWSSATPGAPSTSTRPWPGISKCPR